MPRRGMGVEIMMLWLLLVFCWGHAPQGHGSRNCVVQKKKAVQGGHAPQGHGSRNHSRKMRQAAV